MGIFRLSVQTVSRDQRNYHLQQDCTQDEKFFPFFEKVTRTTYGECIDKNYPVRDSEHEGFCWTQQREHECQFCAKLGFTFESGSSHTKIEECKAKGYKIAPCLDAPVEHKKEVMCTCDTPREGRAGRYTCDDGSHHSCTDHEICHNSQPFRKNDPPFTRCETSQCYLNRYVTTSEHFWTACGSMFNPHMHNCRTPNGLQDACCCDNGYKLMPGSDGLPSCVACGPNEYTQHTSSCTKFSYIFWRLCCVPVLPVG